jgi:hypothetical protein
MERFIAEVTVLESFALGKNTAKNAGIEVKVYGKGVAKGRGPQLGTIRIGQGSLMWWAKNKRTKSASGEISPTVRLDWDKFAQIMNGSKEK